MLGIRYVPFRMLYQHFAARFIAVLLKIFLNSIMLRSSYLVKSMFVLELHMFEDSCTCVIQLQSQALP